MGIKIDHEKSFEYTNAKESLKIMQNKNGKQPIKTVQIEGRMKDRSMAKISSSSTAQLRPSK
jgi:hypothetical protein